MNPLARIVLISLLSLTFTLNGCSSFPEPKHSNRLLGSWVSDKERTLKEISKKPEITPRTRALLNNDFFGKLKITYYSDTYESELEGEVIKGEYKILEISNDFIEIEERLEGMNKSFRSKIYFEDDYLVVYSRQDELKEYFKKVK